MPEIPAFKSHFLLQVLDASRFVLLSEHERYLVEGPLFGLIAPHIDGKRTPQQIAEALEGQASESDVRRALEFLQDNGYLTSPDPSLPEPQRAFWEAMGIDSATAAVRLRATHVSVISSDDLAAELLAGALESAGVTVAQDGHLQIVITDDYLNAGLPALNRAALANLRPWMLLKPGGREQWLGPVFVPGRTGCWNCLARRLRENRWVETSLGISSPYPAELPAASAAALQLAAVEIGKWIAFGKSETLEARVWTIDSLDLSVRRHELTRQPHCPDCGQPAAQRRGVVLHGRPKLSPQDTLALLERHVSPITGIVSEFRVLPSSHPRLHLCSGSHNLPLPRCGQPATVVGKGLSLSQAKVSCLAEAIERYSAVFQGDEPRIRASYRNIADRAIHPSALLHFSPRQYRDRASWNQKHGPLHRIPEPFDDEIEIEWTPAWSLTRNESRYVPTAYCYLRYPLSAEHRFCAADGNGCAAGSVIEEAVLHGFAELVERDAVALWWYNRVRRPAVDLASFSDPLFNAIESHFARLGRTLHVLDVTTDLAIPAFVAVSWKEDGASILFGLGAHLDARLGVTRAIVELNQVIEGAKTAPLNPEASRWLETATIQDQPYATPSEAPKIQASQYAKLASDDLLEDIRRCVDRAASCGLETLVVDLTRPDLEFPAVRVMVPGLRHMWARSGPGRLYDAPQRLGWVTKPTEESELNPTPFFL